MKKLLLGITLTVLAACGGNKAAPPPVPAAPAPECDGPLWTCFTSGPCPIAEYKGMLCAVGRSDSIASMSLGSQAASTQARAEVAAILKSRVDSYTRIVQDSMSKAGYGEDSTQKVGNMAQNVVAETLVGVSIPRTWYNKETKVHYAMALVDAKTFGDAVKGLSEAANLSEAVKADINKRTESVVKEWESERDRLKGQ
jgi:hypothetical protein